LSRLWFFRHPDKLTSYTGWLQLYTAVLSTATVALVGATIYSAIVLRHTDEKIGRQLDEMQATRRPWITVKAEIAGPLVFVPTPHIDVNFTIKNIGQSPAMSAWINTDMVLLSRNSDTVREMRRRCSDLQRKELARQNRTDPIRPGYTLFPSDQVTMTRTVSIEPDEYERWATVQKMSFMSLELLVCGDYKFSFSSEIHSTDMVYGIATADLSIAGRIKIIILPQNWNMAFYPEKGPVDPGTLKLYDEGIGNTYAD